MSTTVRGPYDRPTSEIFFNTFKAANPRVDYSIEQVALSDIRGNDDPSTRYALNTMATVTGVESRGRSGRFVTRWDRKDIAKVFSRCNVYISYTGQEKISDLLPSINAAYPIQLQLDDIYDANLVGTDKLPMQVNIPMHANNLAFVGVLTVTLGA